MKRIGLAIFGGLAGLKLAGLVQWSWWWITLPLWGVPAFLCGMALLTGLAGHFIRQDAKTGPPTI